MFIKLFYSPTDIFLNHLATVKQSKFEELLCAGCVQHPKPI